MHLMPDEARVPGDPLGPRSPCWLVSLISYIDRNTLALLAPTILHETGLSAEQYGFIISGFSIAYMIGNPVWGRILDRVGLRARDDGGGGVLDRGLGLARLRGRVRGVSPRRAPRSASAKAPPFPAACAP